MEHFDYTKFINKIYSLNQLVEKEPVLDFLIHLKENNGGHITVNQILDFLKENGYLK